MKLKGKVYKTVVKPALLCGADLGNNEEQESRIYSK